MPVVSRATQVGRWWGRTARRASQPFGVLGRRSRVRLVAETRRSLGRVVTPLEGGPSHGSWGLVPIFT